MKRLTITMTAIVTLLSRGNAMAEDYEQVYVPTFDGTYLYAELRLPPGDGPHPAIIYIHGGRGGSPPGPGYSRQVRSFLLAEGYAYLDLDYRRYHVGPGELEDAVAGYRYLCDRPEIDAKRVAVLGDSHGGFIALMLATRERPAAVVAYAGIADPVALFYEHAQTFVDSAYRNYDWYERWLHGGRTIREESDLMASGRLPEPERVGLKDEVSQGMAFRWGSDIEIYRRYSPLEQYALIESPVLYVVGEKDNFKHAGQQLVSRLQAAGRTAIYSEHPGMGHGFAWGKDLDEEGNIHPEFYRSLELTTSFLRKWVRDYEAE